jgi:REP element-mobilizing transposase RayT
MARLPRLVIPNQPLHIMHRGNNRQDIFNSEDDMLRVKEDIAHGLKKSECSLHAYVIMTNHLHFLITPESKEGIKGSASLILWLFSQLMVVMHRNNNHQLYSTSSNS